MINVKKGNLHLWKKAFFTVLYYLINNIYALFDDAQHLLQLNLCLILAESFTINNIIEVPIKN